MPVISIVIPALQEEKTLPGLLALFPLELRGRHRAELIVSDGGSTDGTLAAARAGADTVVEHAEERRQTIAEGRNRGAEAASVGILLFLNADVRPADPDRLLSAVAAAFVEPGVCGVACRVEVEPGEATRFDRVFHRCFNAWCRLLARLGHGMGRGECQAVPAAIFREAGGYDASLAAAEDYDLFRRIAGRGRIRFLDEVTVYESPRRYRALGYPRVLALWFANALSVAVRGRARSREWTPVR